MAGPADSDNRRLALKQRAAAARAQASATKAWDTQVKAAAAGTLWRVSASWIEQGCGTRCADLTHVGNGKVRTIRSAATDPPETCRALIADD